MSDFAKEKSELKNARDKLLSFHKILIDRERKELERMSGAITPGQFLGLLMNDERFEWLRTISRLVVRIDEAFEIDDGIPPELVQEFRRKIAAMFDDSDTEPEFKGLVSARIKKMPEADSLRTEILALTKK